MSSVITLPMWLVAIMAIAATASIYRHAILPLGLVYLRSKERMLNQQLQTDLARQLPEVLRIGRRARIELFINSPEVKQAINDAEAEGQGTRELLEHKVLEFAEELTPGFYSLFYFKIGYFLARSYIRLLYQLKIAKPPPSAIGEIPEGSSIVLVGNHRSNLDVMMLAYLSSRTNMVSFAAGEWGRAWPMSTLLHLSGSYIIRRSEPLPVYRKILAMHLRNLVKVKMPQGIFLEGGLTRDGAIQSVKLGLMNYLLSALDEPNVEDIVFIPVAFNYDQVPEDKTLLSNQEEGFSGRSKFYTVFSTLGSLLAVITQRLRLGRSIFGNAAVSFGEPLSINQWLEKSNVPRPLEAAQKHAMVAPVADDLIGRIEQIIPVLPISLVATVFIEAGDNGVSMQHLLERVKSLYSDLRDSNAVVIFDEDQIEEVVHAGLEMLLSRQVLLANGKAYSVNPKGKQLLEYLYNTTKHLLKRPLN